MAAPQVFRELFRDPGAERELAALGGHVSLPTFNLATTSLRHLSKWYDRLQDIQNGVIRSHPNYVSDPESLGLVRRTRDGARLTNAGQRFLATRGELRNHPARAEYELVKVLYYSGIVHSAAVQEFLSRKRQNLLWFLRECHLCRNAGLVLRHPKLLAIAEALLLFPGALHRFLELPPGSLATLEGLGEQGFRDLWDDTEPPQGLGRLARKIGSDYARAEDRRLHFLMAVLLLELGKAVSQRGLVFADLEIPEPFSRFVTGQDLVELHERYTSEVAVVHENGRTLLLVAPAAMVLPPPAVSRIGVRAARPGRGRRPPRSSQLRTPAPRTSVFDAALAREAEDYVYRTVLEPRFGGAVVRIGHTNLEQVLLPDGMLPGADFYLQRGAGRAIEAFFEVKSSSSARPGSVTVTRAEYRRAKQCQADRIPYELFVVSFPAASTTPNVYHMPDFADRASVLSIEDVIAFDLALDYE